MSKEDRDGKEKRRRRLQDRRSCRRERSVLGGRRQAGREDGGEIVARSAHRRGHQDGHEGRGRKGDSLPHARVALLQVRSVILRTFAELTSAVELERRSGQERVFAKERRCRIWWTSPTRSPPY